MPHKRYLMRWLSAPTAAKPMAGRPVETFSFAVEKAALRASGAKTIDPADLISLSDAIMREADDMTQYVVSDIERRIAAG